jgi:hypothetical protein
LFLDCLHKQQTSQGTLLIPSQSHRIDIAGRGRIAVVKYEEIEWEREQVSKVNLKGVGMMACKFYLNLM